MTGVDRQRPLARLRGLTEARVALGRSGAGVPTAAALSFALDHARAREAVWSPLDAARLEADIAPLAPVSVVHSAVPDRADYLRRPDLGRRLATDTRLERGTGGVLVVIGDGLSATAVHLNALPVVQVLLPRLAAGGLALDRVVIAQQARVALGDAVAAQTGAEAVVMLIGERPGLSASDSLGAYITWAPAPDLPNARRNCISNIREGGLPPAQAAAQIADLLARMARAGTSGVGLDAALAALPPG